MPFVVEKDLLVHISVYQWLKNSVYSAIPVFSVVSQPPAIPEPRTPILEFNSLREENHFYFL